MIHQRDMQLTVRRCQPACWWVSGLRHCERLVSTQSATSSWKEKKKTCETALYLKFEFIRCCILNISVSNVKSGKGRWVQEGQSNLLMEQVNRVDPSL